MRSCNGSVIKRLVLATSCLVVAGSASAADLPVRMPVKALPPVAPVPYTWTGCSVGGHVGAGWSRTDFSDPGSPLVDGSGSIPNITEEPGQNIRVNSGAGFLGGVQAGCDYQFAGNWVIGIGGDVSWANINGHTNDPFDLIFGGKNGGPITLASKTDRLATLTGRIGYTWDHVLLYAKGGAAWAHDRYSVSNLTLVSGVPCSADGDVTNVACNATASTNRTGWTVGAGLEWAFAQNWSFLAEYDHYGFDNKTLSFSDPNTIVPIVALLNVKQNIDVVKVGVNYRFSLAPFVGRD
jgi:outer membrane immunogenic protein